MPPLDIRAGTIVKIDPISASGSYELKINFGSIVGIRSCLFHTSPDINIEALIDKHVCAIIDFPNFKKNTKTFDTILLCMPDIEGYYIPIQPDHHIPNGGSLFS